MSDSFQFISIAGPDAEKFLQGQLTCDIRDVKIHKISFGAYCNVKGRVVTTFHIFFVEDVFYLILPEVMVEKTLILLRKYGAFSKVKIEQTPRDAKISFPSLKKLPFSKLEGIQAEIPIIYPQTSEMFTPHMLNLPALNAVSFNKGCYLGQEVIARTEYLGKAKRNLKKLIMKSDKDILPGDQIIDNNNQGIVINAIVLKENEWLVLAVV